MRQKPNILLGNEKIIELLIKYEARVNAVDEKRSTVLHHAASIGDFLLY